MNPFVLGYIRPENKLCDREKEREELCRHANNLTHVVITSSRRLGKTSLVWHVLDELHRKGFVTIYIDLLSVTRNEIFINKFASAIAKGIGRSLPTDSFVNVIRNLFAKIKPSIDFTPDGFSISAKFDVNAPTHILISDIFDSLDTHLNKCKKQCLIVFDEFQQLTELPESKEIEGLLREKLQSSRSISCYFVGSKKSILEDMFTNKRRPFYKMTMMLKLGRISRADLSGYIVDMFKTTNKSCPFYLAQQIYDEVEGYTYYVQKLAHLVWDKTDDVVTPHILNDSLTELLEIESFELQMIWSELGWTEKRVLMAVAVEPVSRPYARSFLARHGLSQGSMQKGLKQLIRKDFIELTPDNLYRPVDPLLAKWCKTASAESGI